MRASRVGLFRPGFRVAVVDRVIVSDDRAGGDGNVATYTLNRLGTWLSPDGHGPRLARAWKDRRDDPGYFAERQSLQGPTVPSGVMGLVVSVLPSVACPLYVSRPWVLVLFDGAVGLGWTYCLDAMGVVSVPIDSSSAPVHAGLGVR